MWQVALVRSRLEMKTSWQDCGPLLALVGCGRSWPSLFRFNGLQLGNLSLKAGGVETP